MNIGNLTTYQVNSTSDNYLHIKSHQDLKKIEEITGEIVIFGGGSNILLSKEHYDNITFIQYDLEDKWKKNGEDEDNIYFQIYGGESISKFIAKSLEYTNRFNPIYGLPGNIAGAIVGNTGSFDTHMGQFVKSVYVYDFDNKEYKTIEKKDIKFGRRTSSLAGKNHLIISAEIRIPKEYNAHLHHYLEYAKRRIKWQPIGKSCGKYFRNAIVPKEKAEKIITDLGIRKEDFESHYSYDKECISARWLIQQAGLSGFEQNGVKISALHSNFLMNTGTKKGSDIKAMGDYIKKVIKEKFDIELKEEVRII